MILDREEFAAWLAEFAEDEGLILWFHFITDPRASDARAILREIAP
jgi:hypothetical protein